jgi:cellulose synthase/poly-beta-1,6-N-acetylglucosamine synthase-like glycosyltransferase
MGELEGSERGAIDCLVDGAKLTVTDRRKIEHLSSLWQSGLIETALASGIAQAGDMAQALAAVSGLELLDPMNEPLDARLARREDICTFVRARFMPWRRDGDVLIVAAVNPYTVEEAITPWRKDATIVIKIVTERMLTESLNEALGSEAVEHAIFDLSDRAPELSARGGVTYFQGSWLATIAMLLGFALWRAPGESFAIAGVGSGVFFLTIMLFRLVLMIAGLTMPKDAADLGRPRTTPGDLPAYSILVALHDETALLPQIIAALSALDYPATKLDILLLLEESDSKTRATCRALMLDSRFRVLTVPDRFPRTKPKACNFGLAFARGDYIALYDAEDRPDPEQLLRALAVFEAHSETECVQGRLSFYNARENWLTRQFAIEFAQWFSFMLPGLARFQLPVPLGGTSNHFRRAALEKLGAWDAFNVTEDADIGMRLARNGGRVRIISSNTAEEANCELGNWLHQRSRWLKGYLQTWLVHMRSPARLYRELGLAGFMSFQLLIGGALISALLHLAFWTALILGLCGIDLPKVPWAPLLWPFTLVVLIVGNGAAIASGVIAALHPQFKGQGRFVLALNAVSMPLYWFLISFAALKAIASFASRPFYWAKTRHGISRFAIAIAAQNGISANGGENGLRANRSRHKPRDE